MASNERSKTLTPAKFRDQGYLMEANRLFFHPLGLALAITYCKHEDHAPEGCTFKPHLGPIFDFRSNPEGALFGEEFTDDERQNAARIDEEFCSHLAARANVGCDPDSGAQPLVTEPAS